MSDHFEGTWFDPSNDVGAGAELSPYRWNGLEWAYNGSSTSTSASSAHTHGVALRRDHPSASDAQADESGAPLGRG